MYQITNENICSIVKNHVRFVYFYMRKKPQHAVYKPVRNKNEMQVWHFKD